MSDNSIYYMIKLGDSLENISKKTGIPLNSLLSMKSDTFTNVNHLNLGDQIVWKDGVATYENHLYGPLSQKPQPKPISNNIIDKELVTDDVPISKSSTDMETATSEKNPVSSNSPTKSCEVCGTDTCLCEVEIIDVQPDIAYFLKNMTKLKNEKNKRLKNHILFCAVKEEQKDEKIDPKKIALDIRYKVSGECVNNNKDKGCVSVYIKEYSDLVPKEPLKASVFSKDIGPSYNKLIEPIVKGSNIYHKTSEECASYKEYKRPYDSDKKVLITTDGEHITDLVQPSVLDPFYFFMRGFNFLLQGNLNYFPANIYRFGVITCNKEDINIVDTQHYTDLIILPPYKVSFTGELQFSRNFTGISEQTTATVEVTFKEEVNGEEGDTIKFSYETMRERFAGSPPPNNSGFANKLLNQMFKIGDFLNKVKDLSPDAGGPSRLFTIEPLTPKIVVGADASLWFDSNKNIEINRLREIKEENKEFIDPDKPFLANGIVNVPKAKDQPNRDEYNTKIENDIEKYNKSYLRFDPLIGGVFAINCIQLAGKIPAVATVVGILDAFDCDIFNKMNGEALVWDNGKSARDKLLKESNGKLVKVKVYMFCSCDISFSPGLLLHNEKPNTLGGSFELRGSLGAGFSAGALGEVNLAVIQFRGQMQGSYGIRIYFSIDHLTGLTKFWHDGIGGNADISSSKDIASKTSKGASRKFGGSIKSGNISIDKSKDGIDTSYDLSNKEKITDEGWRDSKYDPAIDNPYDNPVINVPYLYQDPSAWKIWTNRKEPVENGPKMPLPNPVSRYVRENDQLSKAEWLKKFQRHIGGTEAEKEAYANRMYEEYEEMINKHKSAKQSSESGYWVPPTSFANPSYTFNAYKTPTNEVKTG